jgi:hypothetical protein
MQAAFVEFLDLGNRIRREVTVIDGEIEDLSGVSPMFVAGLRRQRETAQPFANVLRLDLGNELFPEPRLKLPKSLTQAFRMTFADLVLFESAFEFSADLSISN